MWTTTQQAIVAIGLSVAVLIWIGFTIWVLASPCR